MTIPISDSNIPPAMGIIGDVAGLEEFSEYSEADIDEAVRLWNQNASLNWIGALQQESIEDDN